MEWQFDPIHNHWRSGRYIINVQFNERGTRHFFNGSFLSKGGLLDLVCVKRLKTAQETCEKHAGLAESERLLET